MRSTTLLHTIRTAMPAVLLAALPGHLLGDGPAGTGIGITKSLTTVAVVRGETPYCAYQFGEVPYKPYVKTLCTPQGVNILRDAPHDHLHHHALMFAVSVDGVDFWGEAADRKQGRQVGRGLETEVRALPDGRSAAVLRQKLDWHGIDAERSPLLSETRTIRAYAGPGLDASLLAWRSELRPAAGKDSVVLGGAHYYGLGMRFVKSMDRSGQFTFAPGEPGEVIRGKQRLTPTKWVAYSAAVDGHTVTVALFDHPENPRHPAAMFTMPERFAYISATLGLSKQPLKLHAGRPLVLRYGVALWDGEVDRAAIESLYAAWLRIDAAGQ